MPLPKLNRRIHIQTQSTTQDAAGGLVPVWSTVYTCWASIDIQESQRVYSTAEFMSSVANRITLRWTSSVIISANQRVVYKEPTTGVVHTYEIKTVTNTKQANREIVLMCYAVKAQE
jgi:SPP1 family predicted phage head-tail adaptor